MSKATGKTDYEAVEKWKKEAEGIEKLLQIMLLYRSNIYVMAEPFTDASTSKSVKFSGELTVSDELKAVVFPILKERLAATKQAVVLEMTK